jgi:2-hydroxy-3-keto-5-methylthiopentenyl-1-phosphate phosphatase
MVVPGLEPMLPSTRSAIRSILQRVFMHRRLWLNDPDCLMVRTRETKLLPHEARTLADVIAATGGMVVFSDDVDLLGEAERAWVREVVELGREVDLASPRGVARLVEPLARDDSVRELQSDLGRDVLQTTMNLSDASAEASGWAGTKLRAHQSASRRLESARDWAIFCDFDGTFSVQDVGDTLARQRLPERRAELWQRYTAGELDAWRYQEILFADHDFSRDELEAFLATIELDPGAAELVEWCDHEHVPLRILSDGFDHNLDRLQAMHGIRFDYAANHLEFSGDRWRITPGGRNLHCACGTGSCKRAQIDLFRSAHPGAYCVHIGNGRISDLCGALVADLVFAKGTLSDALRERGVFHHGFDSLSDVVVEIGRRRTRSRRWAVAPIPG